MLLCPKPSPNEKSRGLSTQYKIKEDVSEEKKYCEEDRVANNHPTWATKPLKLFQYLIVLGSREGDVILDPFAGSGTSCIAAVIEKRKYIGIEMDAEYCNIAKARIKYWKSKTKTMFDNL